MEKGLLQIMTLRTFILAVLLVHLAKAEIMGQAVQVQIAQGYTIGDHIAEEPQFTYGAEAAQVVGDVGVEGQGAAEGHGTVNHERSEAESKGGKEADSSDGGRKGKGKRDRKGGKGDRNGNKTCSTDSQEKVVFPICSYLPSSTINYVPTPPVMEQPVIGASVPCLVETTPVEPTPVEPTLPACTLSNLAVQETPLTDAVISKPTKTQVPIWQQKAESESLRSTGKTSTVGPAAYRASNAQPVDPIVTAAPVEQIAPVEPTISVVEPIISVVEPIVNVVEPTRPQQIAASQGDSGSLAVETLAYPQQNTQQVNTPQQQTTASYPQQEAIPQQEAYPQQETVYPQQETVYPQQETQQTTTQQTVFTPQQNTISPVEPNFYAEPLPTETSTISPAETNIYTQQQEPTQSSTSTISPQDANTFAQQASTASSTISPADTNAYVQETLYPASAPAFSQEAIAFSQSASSYPQQTQQTQQTTTYPSQTNINLLGQSSFNDNTQLNFLPTQTNNNINTATLAKLPSLSSSSSFLNLVGGENISIGLDNVIDGQNNHVVGNVNQVAGNSNQLHGDTNQVSGSGNSVKGNGNLVIGSRNTIICP